MTIPTLAMGVLSRFNANWKPNTTPDQVVTQAPATVLPPDGEKEGERTRGVGVGVHNRNREKGG